MSSNTITSEQGNISSKDGTRLFFSYSTPVDAKDNILIVHGFGDHCGRYDELTDAAHQRGLGVMRFDYRGHGRSEGRRGHIYRFDAYLNDLEAAYEKLQSLIEFKTPPMLMAHSYGGLIAAHGLNRLNFKAAVLSSPFFGFALKVPAWKRAAGHLLSRYIPAMSMPTDIKPESVSHDPATIQEYATDPLIGRVATTRWLTETEAAHVTALNEAQRLDTPIYIQQAGDDKLVCPESSKRFYDLINSNDKAFTRYPKLFHEIWFELERQPVIDDAFDWLETQR